MNLLVSSFTPTDKFTSTSHEYGYPQLKMIVLKTCEILTYFKTLQWYIAYYIELSK